MILERDFLTQEGDLFYVKCRENTNFLNEKLSKLL